MDGTCEVDGLRPREILIPETADEAAAMLAAAREQGLSVLPIGGCTALQIGNPPAHFDLALSTARLSGIVEYSPGDMTVVVRAGTTLRALQSELARHRQFVPLHPPHDDRSTVGGTLAVAATGPWTAAFGAARDITIGMRMALPSGTVAKSGGKVVKNVAGYDLAKLFIGSYGTLGVVVEAAFKVYPLPVVQRLLRITAPSAGTIATMLPTVRSLGRGVLSVAIHRERTEHHDAPSLILWLGGSERLMGDLEERLKRVVYGSGAGLNLCEDETGAWLQNFPASATHRIATPPSRLVTALDMVPFDEAVLYPEVGVAFARSRLLTAEVVEAARVRIALAGGQITLLHVPLSLKRAVDVWGPVGPQMDLMHRVKNTFDPDSVMSPGRFVGGI
jgi:glycolate oxidase FAD binding subunit